MYYYSRIYCIITYNTTVGAGFQTRFIAPIIPCTSILAAHIIIKHKFLLILGYILLCLSSFYILYYSILYTNMYADLDYNIWEIIQHILEHSYYAPPTREYMEIILKYMSHFGLKRSVS